MNALLAITCLLLGIIAFCLIILIWQLTPYKGGEEK